MARVPERDVALDWRHRDSWHARGVDHLLSKPRYGAARERSFRPDHRSLYLIRALRALDDRNLLHHPGDFGIEHYVWPPVAAAADRSRGVFRMVAMGKICAKLPELPVHHRSRADLPDVDWRKYPEQGGCRLAQARWRYRGSRSSA